MSRPFCLKKTEISPDPWRKRKKPCRRYRYDCLVNNKQTNKQTKKPVQEYTCDCVCLRACMCSCVSVCMCAYVYIMRVCAFDCVQHGWFSLNVCVIPPLPSPSGGFGIAQLIERGTRDRKPGRNVGRIFFVRFNFCVCSCSVSVPPPCYYSNT